MIMNELDIFYDANYVESHLFTFKIKMDDITNTPKHIHVIKEDGCSFIWYVGIHFSLFSRSYISRAEYNFICEVFDNVCGLGVDEIKKLFKYE